MHQNSKVTLQHVFWPSLAAHGSVCNSEYWILDGFSARIFCLFMPRGDFLSSRSKFWIWGQHFGPGTFSGQKWVPRKWICDGSILWWQFGGNFQTQMNSIIYRTHLGRLLCPKPLLFIISKGFPDVQENWWDPGTIPLCFVLPLGTLWPYFSC